VEVLMKKEVVAPPRIGLEPLYAAEARSASAVVDEKDRHETFPEVGGHDIEGDLVSRSSRVFDRELVAEEFVDALQRGRYEVVQRKPHRATPVRVAAEHRRGRLRRLVVDPGAHTLHIQDVWVVAVVRGQGTQPVRRQELRRIEQGST